MYKISPNKIHNFWLILSFLAGLSPGVSICQTQEIQFDHLSSRHGQEVNTVNAIVQDKSGFIWIGGNDGLKLFDGYILETFLHDSTDNKSISDDNVLCLLSVKNGDIWIGTGNGGLNILTPNTHQFAQIKAFSPQHIFCLFEDSKNQIWLGTNKGLYVYTTTGGFEYVATSRNTEPHVTCIAEDDKGRIWAGSRTMGILTFSRADHTQLHLADEFPEFQKMIGNEVTSLMADRNKNIWLGAHETGLIKFNPSKKEFTHFKHEEGNLNTIRNNDIRSIVEDHLGNIWLGTMYGITKINPADNSLLNYTTSSGLVYSYVYSLFEDRSNIMWVSTHLGISKFNNSEIQFSHYGRNHDHNNSLDATTIWCLAQENESKIWVGTDIGFGQFDLTSRTFISYTDKTEFPFNFENQAYRAIFKDSKNNLWLGSHGGLIKWNMNNNTRQTYTHNSENERSLSNNSVYTILEDSRGYIWIGTGEGLNIYDPKTNEFTQLKRDLSKKIILGTNGRISTIFESNEGDIWIGSHGGLYVIRKSDFDIANIIFEKFILDPNNRKSISNNSVTSIVQTSDSKLWFGTYGGGLNTLNQQTKEFERFNEHDGLANNSVDALLLVDDNALWISTENGMSKLNIQTRTFTNFSTAHGLQSNEFCVGSYAHVGKGLIAFGGVNGFNVIDPSLDYKVNDHPLITLTSLKILNEKQPIDVDMSEHETLTLSYKDKMICFTFSALDYLQAKEISYKYKLEGFDDEWIDTPYSDRKSTYTNLHPGKYTFRVKASNRIGEWNEEEFSINIRIMPPYWETYWFYAVLMATGSFLIWLLFSQRTKKLHLQQQHLEQEVQLRTQEIVHQRDEISKQNIERGVMLKEIHHRVKNNLQVINSLLRLQSEQIKDAKALSLFEECQNRILSMALIHEKMYQSKDLANVKVDEYIAELAANLIRTYSQTSSIKLNIHVDVYILSIDILVPIGMIINELISNSLKYGFKPNENGKITVKLTKNEQHEIELFVADNGIGLSDDMRWREPTTLGMELIQSLVAQIDGRMERIDQAGTAFLISFMVAKNEI